MGKAWTFTQLGGQRRTLTLSGEAAPHGRPRREPVVSDGIRLRRARTYYPDKKGPPTTHIFGIQYEPWELNGRFNDRYMGAGGTKQTINDWLVFVADQQPISVSWGDVLSARGFVDAFIPGRESEFQATYKITLLIDDEPGVVGTFVDFPATRPPQQIAQDIADELSEFEALPSRPESLSLTPSFLESLDDAVSSVNSFSASLLNIAQQIDDFESGTIDQLERLRAGVAQTRTAVIKLSRVGENGENDVALIARSGDFDVSWSAVRTSLDVTTSLMMAALDEMDRDAEVAQRGQLLTVYVARGGDTWESISTNSYGGPSGASRIRDANGIRFGELPVPGRSYQIPRAA